ncbi:oxidoreductase [Rhodococcus sp. PAMC28707]|uniref:PDR/VanB family oxidoreductase n=1 Tax=unclassified Rhodococcus (in: high G+C Gram-positive bacteria) TaxID=192944 RepID=UPI00109DE230|nr:MULTISPECIES: PDR/VanB family oxidoreductase [unclassified Rhodococcus (in: high G+C Gram-positive bacteria)]QCB49643.1 oxidoreductase [Rhodococcus sp. PAMC28705]QCB58666.1 oxidoreductase [Rhodococcus sp. PAMC28707]
MTQQPTSVETRSHLGDTTVTDPGVGLRAIGAVSRIYAKLVTDSSIVTALSPARPRRSTGYEFEMIIDDIVEETEDVRSLLLRRRDGAPLPTWHPGAHVDITTPSGELRQYSLAGLPTGGEHYRISVRRIPGGRVSSEIHNLECGDLVRVRGPRNAFPMARADNYLFVAAGIGITPIRSMIERAVVDKVPWTLYYHGRSRATLPFVAELSRLALTSGGRLILAADDIDGLPNPETIIELAAVDSAMYVCGPAALSRKLRDESIRNSRIQEFHAELFAPPAVTDGKPFTLHLNRSGETIAVGAQETALDALRRSRPDQPYSCRQGFCGVCVVGLVEGRVDHRDRVLDATERKTALTPCVSRAAAGGEVVVLDL